MKRPIILKKGTGMKKNDPTPEFEQLVRRRLGEFADQAPTTVRQLDELPVRTAVVASSTDDRRFAAGRRRIAGIGAAVIALGGGLALTTVAATGGDDGGANTPEDAVIEFIDAIEQRDVIGALDVLDPAESALMVDVVRDLADEAERIGLLGGGADLRDVSGASIAVENLVLNSETIGDGLALVHLDGGRADVEFDVAALPFGAPLDRALDRAGSATTVATDSTDLAESDLSIATVQRSGRWFVSVGFTVAETVRSIASWPSPLEAGTAPEGFDSPEAAATAWWTRLASFDISGAIDTAAPGEGDALARYAPLWAPDLEARLNESSADGLDVELSDFEFEVTGDGDRRTVRPTAYRASGSLPPLDDNVGLPPFDPNRPTLVYAFDGSGFYVIAAGDPIPESFDDLEVLQDFDDEMLSIDDWNSANLLPNGDLQRFWTEVGDDPPTEGPRAFTIDFADGCSTVSGLTVFDAMFGSPGSNVEELDNGDIRSCGPTDAITTLSTFGFYYGSPTPPSLPSIGVYQMDDRWYMSPIGTIGAVALEVAARIEDGAALSFDSPLGAFVYGITPSLTDQMIVGRTIADVDPACGTVVVVGDDGMITGIVDEPSVEDLNACVFGAQFLGGAEEPSVIEIPASVPSQTMPLDE